MVVGLARASREILLRYQAESGAFVASPRYGPYRYSWVRDGSFIAYALDLVGEREASAAFHRWVARVVAAYAHHVEDAIARRRNGLSVLRGGHLHCRYTLEGREALEEWPTFQLDGWGAWLWALEQHLALGSDEQLWREVRQAAEQVTRYVQALWDVPCFDCWEEHGDQVHTSTLACLFGGLQAAGRLFDDAEVARTAERIRARVLESAAPLGRFTKFVVSSTKGAGDSDVGAGVDASLLWCAVPFRLVEASDPLMEATISEIERRCVDPGGGVHRYPADTYYGGGAWLLLTAWLGWYYAETGRTELALRCLTWVEARARHDGEMPEQVPEYLNSAGRLAEWEARWGPSACPLLWSHAMYLVLSEVVKR